jgi:mono/diheme cytochrome c family protein
MQGWNAILVAMILGMIIVSSDAHADKAADSAALFSQMAKVLQHPRCINCHTKVDYPKQGDDRHPHTLNVSRGPNNQGAAGLHCGTCHQQANQPASGVPGAADWQLAPLRMAWEGLTDGELCRAIRDPKAGAMQPAQMIDHFHTSLVVWAWSPGVDAHGRARTTPPMSFDSFIDVTKRWIASGAECPR